jgi:hypothetical protein
MEAIWNGGVPNKLVLDEVIFDILPFNILFIRLQNIYASVHFVAETGYICEGLYFLHHNKQNHKVKSRESLSKLKFSKIYQSNDIQCMESVSRVSNSIEY